MSRVPRWMLVTDRHATAGRDLVDVVAAAVDAGCPAVQLREKDLTGRALFILAERLRVVTTRAGALLLINGRADIAVGVDADGVHLGGGAIPVATARELVGAERLVGVSTHSAADVAAAARAGADYAVFGPVFATPSKAAFGPPQGLVRLADAITAANAMPVLAIGGVTVERIPSVMDTAAAGVAVIRAVLAAPDAAAACRDLTRALASA